MEQCVYWTLVLFTMAVGCMSEEECNYNPAADPVIQQRLICPERCCGYIETGIYCCKNDDDVDKEKAVAIFIVVVFWASLVIGLLATLICVLHWKSTHSITLSKGGVE